MTGKFRHSSILLVALGLGCLLILSLLIFSMYTQPIYIWDEAIYANNALEMANYHHYWLYTNNGVPDHYNSKPPLALWLQSWSFQLFSYTEFAFRLPTLLALLGILWLFFIFSKKLKLPTSIFIIASFILLTTKGAIRPHVFLSGDLDGILVFFTTALCLIHLGQASQQEVTNRTIVLSFICLLAGYFTKSTAVLLILPSLLIGYLYTGNIGSLLKKKSLYTGLCSFCGLVVLYYYLRETFDPGYFQVVWDSEFKRYTSKVMSWQVQPFTFYFKNIGTRFNPYYTFITLMLAIPYALLRDQQYRRWVVHIFLLCFVYLIVISIPATKLEWYDAPIYPLWAFGLSIMLYETYVVLEKKVVTTGILAATFTVTLSIMATFLVWQMYSELSAKRIYEPQEEEAALLKQLDNAYHLPSYNVLMDVEENKLHHFDALAFYIKSMRLNKQTNIILKRTIDDVFTGDTLILVQQSKNDSLRTRFDVKEIETGFVTILKIK